MANYYQKNFHLEIKEHFSRFSAEKKRKPFVWVLYEEVPHSTHGSMGGRRRVDSGREATELEAIKAARRVAKRQSKTPVTYKYDFSIDKNGNVVVL